MTLIDLKPVLGQPYIEHTVTTTSPDALEVLNYTEQVINIEFVANGVIFLFVLILVGNILLRTIFPKR